MIIINYHTDLACFLRRSSSIFLASAAFRFYYYTFFLSPSSQSAFACAKSLSNLTSSFRSMP